MTWWDNKIGEKPGLKPQGNFLNFAALMNGKVSREDGLFMQKSVPRCCSNAKECSASLTTESIMSIGSHQDMAAALNGGTVSYILAAAFLDANICFCFFLLSYKSKLCRRLVQQQIYI